MFKKSMFSIVSSFAILNFIGCDLGSNDFDRVQPRRVFLGEISKLLGDNWRGGFASESTAFSSDESIFGKHCVYFDLTPSGPAKPEVECHVYFIFGVEPGRSVEVAEKQPEGFDAWWFKADKNFENISFVLSGDEALIRKGGV